MRVAFLGPEGTFTEEALRASARGAVREIAYTSVYETVMAVERGDVEAAVVPIENSLEGSVTASLDTLANEALSVRIVAEVVHPISHCLIVRPGAAVEHVSRVVSHPQALAQCARFLRERLPAAEPVAAASTAEAVRAVIAGDDRSAALGSRLAAERYGGRVAAERVEDRPDNLTRFVWLASTALGGQAPWRSDERSFKTSVLFWGFNDSSPGALVDVLREFADRDINLTRIESRPRRDLLGRYLFFADLDGGEVDAPVSDALAALRDRVEGVRVLGSYARAAAPESL